MAPSIFISYRRDDAGGHAGRIFDRLRNWFEDNEIFFDVNTLDMGDVFPEHIEEAIHSTKAVLVVIGPDWLEVLNQRVEDSEIDLVRREVAMAIKKQRAGKAKILPILVGEAKMPSCNDLHENVREELGRLPDYQALTFSANQDDLEYQFERLRHCLAYVPGVPKPIFQVPPHDNLLNFHFRAAIPNPPLLPTAIQAIDQAFGAVSRALLDWPQETEGQWIERPELEQLRMLATQKEPTVTALLGGPGGGKSAILARLGTHLCEEGVVLLAMKADRLPREVAKLAQLDDYVGCGVPLAEALRRLADERRVVVLIDQLDALADLMDRRSERLSALLQLINAIRDTPNLQVLVSCREFEFRNDVRLNTLKANEVSLARPSWEQILPFLVGRGMETDGWSEEVRDVLRTPSHLAMFLDYLADGESIPTFTNYQSLLDHVIRERLENAHGGHTLKAAEHIATEMAREEELWLSRSRFSHAFGPELQNLEAEGFLIFSEDGLSLAFRHQTLFDLLRTRAFLRDGLSLAEYILDEKQESLFVRPILWSALNYLRASDVPAYHREFQRLWTHDGLRLHLRYLLIAFLGQSADPNEEEAQWLLSALNNPDFRAKILRSIAGNTGWFSRMQSRLPSLMAAPPDEAQETVGLLRSAMKWEPSAVLSLLEQYWVVHECYVPHAVAVLSGLTLWDSSSVAIAAKFADHAPGDSFCIYQLAEAISQSRPDLAPKVIARYLQAKTNRIAASATPLHNKTDSDSMESEQNARSTGQDPNSLQYEQLIDGHDDHWYGIDKLAQKAPMAFVKHIWPWLADLFERLPREAQPFVNAYRQHHGLAFTRDTNEHQPLQKAIELAIRGFAETETKAFLHFVKANKSSDIYVLHHLLALGLERIATEHPRVVLEYLLDDPRRLAVGPDLYDIHLHSKALISAVVPALGKDDACRLEKAIMGWQQYLAAPKNEDAPSRFYHQKRSRQHRLILLRSFPFDRLSPEGQRHLRGEERALPHTPDHYASVTDATSIGSPMSSEQMAKATDDHIVALFEELTDDTGWDHPRHGRFHSVGGSIPASREFAEFAKTAPDRCLRLIRRFKAGTSERPAGAALAVLGESAVAPAALIACIRELDARGFAFETFRADAARCLREIARRADGLDDAICSLLEGWMTDWHPPAIDGEIDDKADQLGNSDTSEKTGKNCVSFLWGHDGFQILPGGNYPFLDALMLGYLLRKPQEVNGWLEVLERHLKRNENPEVWSAIMTEPQYLVQADEGRALKFFDAFFDRYPEVLHTVPGVRLIGKIQDWLPGEVTSRVVDGWVSGEWAQGPQAAGEIMALKLCRNPQELEAKERIERFLSGDDYEPPVVAGLRLGVALTLVEAWHVPALRALTTPLLVRLTLTENGSVAAEALHSIFEKTDPLLADDHTRELLEALLDQPSILAGRGNRVIVDRLKGLLRAGWHPDLVYKVANALIEEAGLERGDIRPYRSVEGGLVDIALTLHRISETRMCALDLFERLMAIEIYELNDRLRMIDRSNFQ